MRNPVYNFHFLKVETMNYFYPNARLARKVYALCAAGKNVFEICEILAPEYDNHVWKAYDAVQPIYASEKAKIAFAKAYLMNVLSKKGYKRKEIALLFDCTPQRCGQIIKSYQKA